MQVDEMPTAVMGPALQSVFFSRARHRGTMTQKDKHLILVGGTIFVLIEGKARRQKAKGFDSKHWQNAWLDIP